MLRQAGKLLFLLVAFFAITGAAHKAQAFTSSNVTSCLNQLVSTPLCEEIVTQTCSKTVGKDEPKQIQAAPVIAEDRPESIQTGVQTASAALPAGRQVLLTESPILPTVTPEMNSNVLNETTLDSEKIFDLVNQYRTSLGLTPFENNDEVCELALTRSSELAPELANGTLHSGLYNRNLPYWIWENAKIGSDEQETVAWWLSSPVHHESIVGDYQFSCVKCTNTHCSELFTSFSPK